MADDGGRDECSSSLIDGWLIWVGLAGFGLVSLLQKSQALGAVRTRLLPLTGDVETIKRAIAPYYPYIIYRSLTAFR